MKTYLRILLYIKPYKWKIGLYAIFMITSIALLAGSIAFVDSILRILFSTGSTTIAKSLQNSPFSFLGFLNHTLIDLLEKNPDNKLYALGFAIVAILIFNITGNIFKFLANYYMSTIRTRVIEDIRRDTFQKITKLQISYFEGERKGDILTRMTSDLSLIEGSVVISLESLIRDPITLIAFLVLMIKSSFELTIFIFILIPLLGLIISRIGKSLRKDSRKAQGILSWIMSVIDEFTSGVRVVKAFNAEGYVSRIFNDFNRKYSRLARRQQIKEKSIPLISESLGVIIMGVFLYVGGKLAFSGRLEPTLIPTFVFFFQQISQPAKSLSSAYGNIMKGIASGERLFQLKDAEITIKDRPDAQPLSTMNDSLEFRNVTFAYNSEPVLKNINLKIEKGKVVAIAGPSGSGKTTMAELVPRFYDVIEGSVTIDGIDIRNVKLHDLRDLIAFVTQEPILFNDTIYNNIRFGQENATEEQIIEAAKAANAHDFIMETEEGYQTNIGDRGGLLSGGQRQRLSIARALLKNPPLLILDEATSSLDTASEYIVQEALNRLMKNRTSIVIAHRLSTIQNADLIVVLDKGEIVQTGTHQELSRKAGLYKKLCNMQQLNNE